MQSRKHNPELTGKARDLRKTMTREERHLWYDFLRCYPVKFIRQKVIDNYIADFYCHEAMLVLELDGSQHYSPQGEIRDSVRTAHIESRNIKVLRFPNSAVNQNFRGVCDFVDLAVKARLAELKEK